MASIYAHVADHNLRAAESLRDLIYRQAELLPHHPHAFRKGRLPGTREMVLHPHYILVYAPRADGIIILRLLHSARNWP